MEDKQQGPGLAGGLHDEQTGEKKERGGIKTKRKETAEGVSYERECG